jgi:hypothetical protein
MKDEEPIASMLCGLGPEYDSFLTNITNRVDAITDGDLYAHMLVIF